MTHIPNGETIVSNTQMQANGCLVNDQPLNKKNGTGQRIITAEGYCIPLSIVDGLPYFNVRPYTDDQWKDLPKVVMIADGNWDPSVLDLEMTVGDLNDPSLALPKDIPAHPDYDIEGEFVGDLDTEINRVKMEINLVHRYQADAAESDGVDVLKENRTKKDIEPKDESQFVDEPVVEREGYHIHELMIFDINQMNVADPETYV